MRRELTSKISRAARGLFTARFLLGALLVAAPFFIHCPPARAVILSESGDPWHNTQSPPGDEGWSLVGQWGGGCGVPIGPRHFVTAHHLGGVEFSFAGRTYAVTDYVCIPELDLAVWQIEGEFPRWAELHTGPSAGLVATIIGRGTQRGEELTTTSEVELSDLVWKRQGKNPAKHPPENKVVTRTVEWVIVHGWWWGPSDGVQRWGRNRIDRDAAWGVALAAEFDRWGFGGVEDECALSPGDSGGGWFVQGDDGVWRLAGISIGVSRAGMSLFDDVGYAISMELAWPLLGALMEEAAW